MLLNIFTKRILGSPQLFYVGPYPWPRRMLLAAQALASWQLTARKLSHATSRCEIWAMTSVCHHLSLFQSMILLYYVLESIAIHPL
jgi:hypothetical protein